MSQEAIMKFGLCTDPENLELVERLGFDYIECAVTTLEAMSDADFEAFRSKVNQSSIKVERCNVLLPGTVQLIGSKAEGLSAYLEKVFPRIKALGGSVVVFGSGRSRAFPADMAYGDAFRELIKITRQIGDAAAKYGITVVIEPLNKEETNCVNSVREGAMLQAAVDHPSIGLLADLFHMLKDKEPMENILSAKKITHTHIARLEGRAFPTIADNDIKAFFGALKQIGYSGTMSIEGKAANLEADAAAALKVLRQEAN
jgi:sugar phosphate isomerase/epimerase